jgi:hypothetical protein
MALGVGTMLKTLLSALQVCPGAGHRCNSSQTSCVLMVTYKINQQETAPLVPKAEDQPETFPHVQTENSGQIRGE